MIWFKFAAIQLVMLLAMVAGWFVLLPVCIDRRWWTPLDSKSLKDGRLIDRWNSLWLHRVYGNPEDGVSGQTALVWNRLGSNQIPYKPTRWAWLNAYLWSAWRNSCDNLKYVFADPKGPLVTFPFIGRTARIGWQMENGYNVPVFSL